MKRWLELLTAVIIFLIPTNLFLRIAETTAYRRGLFIDYLLPKLYVADIALLIFLLVYFLFFKPGLKVVKFSSFIWLLAIVLLVRQWFTPDIWASEEYLLHLVVIGSFGLVLWREQWLIRSKIIQWSLVVTLLFQSLVGIYQFVLQRSVFGYLFLGEPDLNKAYGIVRQTLLGSEKILPYGTTSHPNVLGGFISIFLIMLWSNMLEKTQQSTFFKTVLFLTTPLALVTLWCTQSISAWMALAIGVITFGWTLIKQVTQETRYKRLEMAKESFLAIVLIATILTPLILRALMPYEKSETSISRRVFLNEAAWNMFDQNPLVGVGINQFTAELENYAQASEAVKFIQPAHNAGVLILAESGIIGFLFVLLVWQRITLRSKTVAVALLALLPLLVLDHYLISLETGLLLFIVYVSSFREV